MADVTDKSGQGAFGQAAFEGREMRFLRVEPRLARSAFARLEAMTREAGYIVQADGEVREWRVERRAEGQDGFYFYGPAMAGRALSATVEAARGEGRLLTESEARSLLSDLGAAARAMAALEASGRLPGRFLPEAIIVSDSSVLFLPLQLAELAGAASSAPAHLGTQAAFAAFMARAALLLPGSGLSPLLAADKKGRAKAKAMEGISLGLASPRLHPALARLVDASKAGKKGPAYPSMADWAAAFGECGSEFLLAAPASADGELERRRRAALKAELARAAWGRLAARRGLILGLSAAALGFIIIFIVPIFTKGKDLAARLQALSPSELVASYYQAVDQLDIEWIEASADRKASKNDVTMATNINVLTKYRFAIEQRNVLYPAAKWIADGQPDPGDSIVYGLVGLSVKEGVASGRARLFEVEYDLWMTEARDSGDGVVQRRQALRDELRVEPAGKGWRIVSIERTERR
jgi:hypothetical protein